MGAVCGCGHIPPPLFRGLVKRVSTHGPKKMTPASPIITGVGTCK